MLVRGTRGLLLATPLPGGQGQLWTRGGCVGGRRRSLPGLGLGRGDRGSKLPLPRLAALKADAEPPSHFGQMDLGSGGGLEVGPHLSAPLSASALVAAERAARVGAAVALSLVLLLLLLLQPWATPLPAWAGASTSTSTSTSVARPSLSLPDFPSVLSADSFSLFVSSLPFSAPRAGPVFAPAAIFGRPLGTWDVFGRLQRLEDNMLIGAVLIVVVNLLATFLSGKGMEQRMDKQRTEDLKRMDKMEEKMDKQRIEDLARMNDQRKEDLARMDKMEVKLDTQRTEDLARMDKMEKKLEKQRPVDQARMDFTLVVAVAAAVFTFLMIPGVLPKPAGS